MVTPGSGPGYAVGKKGKKRSQIGKILASEASRAVRSPNFFFLLSHADFLLLFSPDSSPVVPRGAWSQATTGASHTTQAQ